MILIMNKQIKDYKRRLEYFLRRHNLEEKHIRSILNVLDVSNCDTLLRPIDKGLTWSLTNGGYNFFYFLSLEWLDMLFRYHFLFTKLFTKSDIIMAMYHLLPYTSDFENDEQVRKKEFYYNFLKKMDKNL